MPCGCFCLLCVTPVPHVSSLCVFGPYPELRKDREGGLVGEAQASTMDPSWWSRVRMGSCVSGKCGLLCPTSATGGWGCPCALGSCPCLHSHRSQGDISYLREQMLVRSFLSSFSCLPELLLGERIKFSFVVGLGENKTKCHP